MKIDSYKVNRKHRDQKPKPDCTQWIVSEWEEIRLFSIAKFKNWVCPKKCLWSIEKDGSNVVELGTDGMGSAYMAKFVSNHNHEWHGYPVTPSRSADRPPTSVLDSWRNDGLINKSQQGKIVKGRW
ncbi:MAG: hypothetical protein GYB15_01435 [Gammaproteobacteria bacterium]|nr:hypothetical protein [Gammaproteobacteria bacterium]